MNSLSSLFDENEDPGEPGYDPVHVGAVLIGCFSVLGALYWLLWTLLVFEGGIFPKIQAAAVILFTKKTAADFGYEASPYAMGVFTGWKGNLGALVILGVVLHSLQRLLKIGERHP